MHPAVKEAKARLRRAGAGHLRVSMGTGTASYRLTVSRPDSMFFTRKEWKAIAVAFGEDTSRRNSNTYGMWVHEAEMRLGLRPKEPICGFCGTTWDSEKDALACGLSH